MKETDTDDMRECFDNLDVEIKLCNCDKCTVLYDAEKDIFICGNCKDQIDKSAYIFNLHVEIENYKQAVSLLEDMVRDLRGMPCQQK